MVEASAASEIEAPPENLGDPAGMAPRPEDVAQPEAKTLAATITGRAAKSGERMWLSSLARSASATPISAPLETCASGATLVALQGIYSQKVGW